MLAPRVAWVAAENLHLTLKFLGNVLVDALPDVSAAIASGTAGTAPFVLEVTGLGAFPTATRPRVLWAGVANGAEVTAALAARIDAALESLGFPGERRAFSAHVTLGRVRVPRRDPQLARAIEAGAEREFGVVRVDAVRLMRSELSPGGARYSEIAAIPLASAG